MITEEAIQKVPYIRYREIPDQPMVERNRQILLKKKRQKK